MTKTESTQTEVTLLEADVQNQIYHIRGLNVMIDSDLAVLYAVETKQLKRQVRWILRFEWCQPFRSDGFFPTFGGEFIILREA